MNFGFLHENILYVGKKVVEHTYVGIKAFMQDWTSSLFVNLVNFLAPGSGSASRRANADPDPVHTVPSLK
jgi:hypothetical protein